MQCAVGSMHRGYAPLLQAFAGSRWAQPGHILKATSGAAQSFEPSSGCSCFQPPHIDEPLQGNPLWAIFQAQRKGPLVRKWSPYMDVYHR
jgi:hypothetical protein